jgi:hypothetical protein
MDTIMPPITMNHLEEALLTLCRRADITVPEIAAVHIVASAALIDVFGTSEGNSPAYELGLALDLVRDSIEESDARKKSELLEWGIQHLREHVFDAKSHNG